MATPGWYPDPGGQPGAFRYWDGSAWGNDLRGDPFGAPPAGATPHPAGPPPSANPYEEPTVLPGTPAPTPQPSGAAPPQPAYYQPAPQQPGFQQPSQRSDPAGWEQSGPGGSGAGTSGGSGRTVAFVVIAVVLAILLGVGSFLLVRSLTDGSGSTAPVQTDGPGPGPTDAPSTGPTDAPSTGPTDAPSPEPSTEPAQPTSAECTAGAPEEDADDGFRGGATLTGGGLAMPEVEGFSVTQNLGPTFTFADGVLAPSRTIEDQDPGWAAVYALGGLEKANGFDDPQQAAETVVDCIVADPDFYTGVTGDDVVGSEAVVVDGAPAWLVTVEIRVAVEGLTVPGDRVQVVVVDTGDPRHFGLFASLMPLDDPDLIAAAEAQVAELRIQ